MVGYELEHIRRVYFKGPGELALLHSVGITEATLHVASVNITVEQYDQLTKLGAFKEQHES